MRQITQNTTSNSDPEQVWNSFWKEICMKPDGSPDIDQIKRELYDFWNLIQNAQKVYAHVTGNAISKLNTCPDAVCAVADDYYEDLYAKRE